MSNSILKQVACIAAYAGGFTFGAYGAAKAVEAIENKWPMKRNTIGVRRTHGIVFSVVNAETRGHVKATVTQNGQTKEFTGTPRQVRVALTEHGFEQYAPQVALAA
jgi:hypothetical protein